MTYQLSNGWPLEIHSMVFYKEKIKNSHHFGKYSMGILVMYQVYCFLKEWIYGCFKFTIANLITSFDFMNKVSVKTLMWFCCWKVDKCYLSPYKRCFLQFFFLAQLNCSKHQLGNPASKSFLILGFFSHCITSKLRFILKKIFLIY